MTLLVNSVRVTFSHSYIKKKQSGEIRVSVQGVKSLGGHFACLCWGFDFYEVKKNIIIFQKEKGNTFNHFRSEKSSKRAK